MRSVYPYDVVGTTIRKIIMRKLFTTIYCSSRRTCRLDRERQTSLTRVRRKRRDVQELDGMTSYRRDPIREERTTLATRLSWSDREENSKRVRTDHYVCGTKVWSIDSTYSPWLSSSCGRLMMIISWWWEGTYLWSSSIYRTTGNHFSIRMTESSRSSVTYEHRDSRLRIENFENDWIFGWTRTTSSKDEWKTRVADTRFDERFKRFR